MNDLFKKTFSRLTPKRPGDGFEGLELQYDDADSIPAGYDSLYSEKNGKFVLTAVKGIKTKDDVERLQSSLNKEREDHKKTKSALSTINQYGTIEEISQRLETYDELKARAESKGKDDPAHIEQLVAAKTAPLQRQLKTLEEQNEELKGQVGTYKQKEIVNTVRGEVTKAAQKMKLRPSAIEDAIMYGERVLQVDENGVVVTKDGVGVTPFITTEDWLAEILPAKSHWLEDSVGGGARGGQNGKGFEQNPYSHDAWDLTAQMALYKTNPTKAEQMAKRHGVDPLNPTRPAKKS